MLQENLLIRRVSQDNPELWGEISTDPNPYNSFCTNGKLANYYLLLDLPVPDELDIALKIARKKYWLEQQPADVTAAKISDWLTETEESIGLEIKIGDQIGLNRDIYWLNQDIWLIRELINTGGDDFFQSSLKHAVQLLGNAACIKSGMRPNKGVMLKTIMETTPEYKKLTNNIVRKWIYDVDTGHGIAPIEVIYTGLDIGKPENERGSVVCLPISVGCPAGCGVCQVGETHIRSLTSDQMLAALFRTVKGYALPRLYPKNLKISWLGGGDPAFNMKEFSQAVRSVEEFYPDSTQVVSTMGVSMKTLEELSQLAEQVSTVSLQVSLLSLNPNIRKELIPLRTIPSPSDVFSFIKKRWENNKKKTYISIMLFENYNESPEEALDLLDSYNPDPESIHITLDIPAEVRKPQLIPFVRDKYLSTLDLLTKAGYEAHIYETPRSAAFRDIGGCGILTNSTRARLLELDQ